jgi:hypothetical protein
LEIGVTVTFTPIGKEDVLSVVNGVIEPVPDEANPMSELVFVH